MSAPTVPLVTLNSGYRIPRIGLGVYELPERERCKRVIQEALDEGYRLIDTAQFYQNERYVGEAIRESGIPREQVFVTTKVYRGFDNKQELQANIQKSLDELDLEYIDLFLMHSPLCGKERRILTWRLLNEIIRENGNQGPIRAIGVSNFGVEHLKQLADAGLPSPDVNQIELHPHLQQREIVEYSKEHGIHVQAYCPLMRGPGSKQSLGEGADWAGMPNTGWDAKVLKDLAAAHSKSIAQTLLRWSCQKGYSPQPKASSRQRLSENIQIFDFTLSPQEIQRIDAEMDLTRDSRFQGKRIALEWNPVDCP